jgi:hypothetical protein
MGIEINGSPIVSKGNYKLRKTAEIGLLENDCQSLVKFIHAAGLAF